MSTTMENLKDMIDVNVVVGDAVETGAGATIIPISRVSFGFVSGGSDIPSSKQPELFGGGAGGGVSVQPLAFLVIKDGRVDLLQMNDNKTTADRVVSMAPEVIDKLGALFQKKEKPAREAKTAGDDPQAGTEIHIDL